MSVEPDATAAGGHVAADDAFDAPMLVSEASPAIGPEAQRYFDARRALEQRIELLESARLGPDETGPSLARSASVAGLGRLADPLPTPNGSPLSSDEGSALVSGPANSTEYVRLLGAPPTPVPPTPSPSEHLFARLMLEVDPDAPGAGATNHAPQPAAATATPVDAAASASIGELAPPVLTPRRTGPIRRRTAPGRTAIVAIVAIAFAALAAALVYEGIDRLGRATTGKSVKEIEAAPYDLVLPDTPTALMVDRATDGTVRGITVFAVLPSGKGGTVIVIPAASAADVPGIETKTPVGSAIADGFDAQVDAVQLLLRASMDSSLDADRSTLADVLGPYGPISVNLDQPVNEWDSTKKRRVTVFPAGRQQLTADEAAHVLLARYTGSDDPRTDESEQELLDRRAAIWRAVLNKVTPESGVAGTDELAAQTTTGAVASQNTTMSVADALSAVASGAWSVVVPTFVVTQDADGKEMYTLDIGELRLLVAQAMPSRVSGVSNGLNAWLVNPLGDPTMARDGAETLVGYDAANLIFETESSEPVPAKTTLRLRSDELRADAEALRDDYFPGASIEVGGPRVDGIDVTVTLGEDFRQRTEASRREKAASTTTVATTSTTASSTKSTKSTNTTKKGST